MTDSSTGKDKVSVLIGGGAGYIGASLVPALIERGYDVTVIDLLWFGNHLPKGTNLIKKDLFDVKVEEMQGFDVFIFLGGLSNDPMAEFSPAKNFVHNAALPAYLAFMAKKAGVKRYVYASSCSVYGYTEDELYDEDSPVTCSYPYGISKLQGERGVFQMLGSDFSVISLRQGTISGYSPRMRFDLIINTMFKAAMTEGKITVNNPSIWRPICDIRDIVSAYVRAVQANPSISGVYNVAGGNYTVGQVGDLVAMEMEKLSGQKPRLDIKNIQDYRNYKVSFDKAGTSLGFQPLFSVQDTVHELYNHRDEYADYSRDEFYNIRTFKKIEW